MSAKATAAAAPEKRKRVRPAAVKRDPVIAALIAKLPAEAATFTRAQRVNWLRQVAMAFDGAYGVELAISIDVDAGVTISGGPVEMPKLPLRTPPAPIAAAPEPDEIRYFIDAGGFARMDPGGKRVKPTDIPNGAEIEDEREGDDELDTIKWADGQWPPAAYPDRSFVISKA